MCRAIFDHRFCAPNARSRQTMQWFGRAIDLPELGGWPRGEYEGRIADDVKAEMARLIEDPDEVPPGLSPLSGGPGKSWNQAMQPLFERIVEIRKAAGTEDRTLIVSSGGQLQAVDAFAAAGSNPAFDRSALAKKPYWTVTGKLFLLADEGLNERPDNSAPGVYMIEHCETYFNFSGKPPERIK